MTEEIIPEDVKQFILQKIDSIAQWEALLLLHSEPSQEWSAVAIAERIYVSDSEAINLLNRLMVLGFLAMRRKEEELLFHYEPRDSEIAEMVERTAALYVTHLVPITNLIHSKAKNRVQKFADAFWLRKD